METQAFKNNVDVVTTLGVYLKLLIEITDRQKKGIKVVVPNCLENFLELNGKYLQWSTIFFQDCTLTTNRIPLLVRFKEFCEYFYYSCFKEHFCMAAGRLL